MTTSDNQALYQPHPPNLSADKVQQSSALGTNSSLAQENSELEKKLSLLKDKISLLEDQCDIFKQEKKELQEKVRFGSSNEFITQIFTSAFIS